MVERERRGGAAPGRVEEHRPFMLLDRGEHLLVAGVGRVQQDPHQDVRPVVEVFRDPNRDIP